MCVHGRFSKICTLSYCIVSMLIESQDASQAVQNLDDGLAQFKASHLGECQCAHSNASILYVSQYPHHKIINIVSISQFKL